nr:protein draper isoform X1 [Crassostrea gigas]
MRTNLIGSNGIDKTVMWKVDLGGVYSIYSVNILFKNYEGYEIRQRGRFAGFSLYVSTTGNINDSTLCYKDGPQLPPLNFTTTCTEHGRYVIFYNERLDGVTYSAEYEVHNVYTELCEVTVQGCKKHGVYGSNCDIPCPINCNDNMCHIENGSCLQCEPGWFEGYCNRKCSIGWHGVDCSQQCKGYCRDGTTCNHVTGLCDKGCESGWKGVQCDKECDNGTYGYNCVHSCSGHCLNSSICNKQTGHCDMGCDPGYTDSNCNKQCPCGRFGNGCLERCSRYCIDNEPCDHVSGECPSGCQDGYLGTDCTKTCPEGSYGKHCSFCCSPNCKTCRHTDGVCTCKAGWTGWNCTTECVNSYGENCMYPCSENCINRICDRFNGSCMCNLQDGGKHHQAYVQRRETTSSSKSWIVEFVISLVANIILVCVILIRRSSVKGQSTTNGAYLCLRCTSNGNRIEASEGVSH